MASQRNRNDATYRVRGVFAQDDGFALDLGIGWEVSNNQWEVRSPIATIQGAYYLGGWFAAVEHQSLVTVGWPVNSRGEVTIDEFRTGRRFALSERWYLEASAGREFLDPIDDTTLTLDLAYQLRPGWSITLQAKALAHRLSSPVVQLRLVKGF